MFHINFPAEVQRSFGYLMVQLSLNCNVKKNCEGPVYCLPLSVACQIVGWEVAPR